jgi:hypothetical protein
VISALTVIFSSGFITPALFSPFLSFMKNIKYIKHKLVRSAAILMALDVIFFGGLNTSKIAQVALVAGFILVVANIYLLAYGVTSLIRLYGIPINRKKRLSLYVSLFLGLIIAMQSTGELTSRDVLVVVPLALIGYAYIGYLDLTKRNEQKIS